MILINSAIEFLDTKSSAFLALSKYNQLLDKFCIITLRGGVFEVYERENILFINIPKITSIFYLFKIKSELIKRKFIDSETFINSGDPFLLAVIGVLLKHALNINLLIQIHTDITSKYFINDNILNRVYYIISYLTLPQAKVISCVNSNTYHLLKERYNDYKDITVQLYHGLNVTNICKIPTIKTTDTRIASNLELDTDPVVVKKIYKYIYPARFVKMKNHKSLIGAFISFHNKFPNTQLYLYGEGSEKDKVAQDILNKKANKFIFVEPYMNNVTEMYNSADFLISTSLYEGFGLTIVEAISYGIPVLATPFGGALSYLDKSNSIISKSFNEPDIENMLIQSQSTIFKVDPDHTLSRIDECANYNKLVTIWKMVLSK